MSNVYLHRIKELESKFDNLWTFMQILHNINIHVLFQIFQILKCDSISNADDERKDKYKILQS